MPAMHFMIGVGVQGIAPLPWYKMTMLHLIKKRHKAFELSITFAKKP
jgi:hypothetical protein